MTGSGEGGRDQTNDQVMGHSPDSQAWQQRVENTPFPTIKKRPGVTLPRRQMIKLYITLLPSLRRNTPRGRRPRSLPS